MEDDTAWIRPLFPPPVARKAALVHYEGNRVIKIDSEFSVFENTTIYALTLENRVRVRLTQAEYDQHLTQAMTPMANEKDPDAPKGLSFKPKAAEPDPKAAYAAIDEYWKKKHAASATPGVYAPSSEPRGLKLPQRSSNDQGFLPPEAFKPDRVDDLAALARRPAKPMPDMSSLVMRPQAPPPPPADMSALLKRNNSHDNPRDHASPVPFRVPPPQPLDDRLASIYGGYAPPRRQHGEPTGVGGDPRAPAMLAKAKALDPLPAADRRFLNKLQQFLDLPATGWSTWADADVRVLTQAASTQGATADKLRLANAVRWATECQESYSKTPSFIDRLTQAAKPEFYRVRLEQAQACLTVVQAECNALITDLTTRLATIRVDALVMQVATEDVTNASDKIIGHRRYQTLVQAQTTGSMILAAAEQLAITAANQSATVGDLLNVTIPNWIIALKNR